MLLLSPSGVASLLAVILQENSGPITPVLETMCGATISAGSTGWARHGMTLERCGTLRAGTLDVAWVTLDLDAGRLPDGAIERLRAGEPAGTVLPSLRRTSRRALNVTWDPARPGAAVISSAVLELGGEVIGQASETVTEAFCEAAARWLTGSGSTPWARNTRSTHGTRPASRNGARRTTHATTR